MADINDYMQRLLKSKEIDVSGKRARLVDEFIADEDNIFTFEQIISNQQILIDRFMNKLKVYDIINQHLQIPNGTVDKYYEYKFDLIKLGKGEIIFSDLEYPEDFGLTYNNETETLSGIPKQSGDFKINFLFRIKGENHHTDTHRKPISLIINADPKSLWKNIPSDEGKDDAWKIANFWKPDNENAFEKLGPKKIVVASKRGRSHANVGSFRDDHFAYKFLESNGWSIVCVADGAGSAKLSRQGSKIACEAVIEYFENNMTQEISDSIDEIARFYETRNQPPANQPEIENPGSAALQNSEETKEQAANTTPLTETETTIQTDPAAEIQKKIKLFLYNNLGKASFAAHKKLADFAKEQNCQLKDLHSTLIFALFKKYESGYAVLTFGVGDCPIGLINQDFTALKLMNWLDVGEFGGGTRFITMPEIFTSEKFPTRFNFEFISDFSYLVLMTDGIYDPKFVVEANLEKLEAWKGFINDLDGTNDANAKVEFNADNHEIANQLSEWMDFWSPGNHDDRTLAIVF
ncbi:MAG: PP2C family serine/threonine-protein phosphatase [Bacteroidetes bacterium]|nr:PP2C family serine/threonine-protein phosphatase [Bacteroidota bacterium]